MGLVSGTACHAWVPESQHSNNAPDVTNKLTRFPSVNIIRQIPKGTRIATADALAVRINDPVKDASRLSWSKIFALLALEAPNRKADGQAGSLTSVVKRQVAEYMSWTSRLSVLNTRTKERTDDNLIQRDGQSELCRRVRAKLEDLDVRGAVRLLSSDDTFSSPDAESLNLLRATAARRLRASCQ